MTGGAFRVTQTDLYVVGAQSDSTRVDVFNNGPLADITLYRAGDCFLQNNDRGYGSSDRAAGSVACRAGTAADSRVEQWAPLTDGSHFFESGFSTVWSRIGAQQPFPDTSDDATLQDNGAGLSWSRTVFGASGASFSHLTAFSPTGTDVSDTDGDGFPSSWETAAGGVDTDNDGQPDYKLSDFGATPDVPDVFVQVNWTQTKHCTLFFFCSTTYRRPSLAALRDVQTAFKAHGVRLHIDAGPDSLMNPDNNATWGQASRVANTGISAPETLPGDRDGVFDWTAAYDGLRSTAMTDGRRARIFHEALYVGRFDADGHSGVSRGATAQIFPGRDFLIAYGAPVFGTDGPTRLEEAGTFMHELGHQLGLSHGGAPEDGTLNWKPNYPSVMNYWWQFSGVPKNSNTALLDYSEGTLNQITESALDERAGLEPDTAANDIGTSWSCPNGTPHSQDGSIVSPSARDVDWNCDNVISTAPVRTNVTNILRNDTTDMDTLRDHDDWHNLIFDGGGTLGGAGDPGAVPATTPLSTEAPSADLAPVLRDLQQVTLDGLSGQTTLKTGTTAPLPVTITNHRTAAVTYRLSSVAGGLTVAGLPDQLTLAPGAAQTLQVQVTAGPVTDAAFLEVDADGGDSSNTASASTQVYVVAETVPDQPSVTGPVDHLVLTPASATVPAGTAQPYTVTAVDAAGHAVATPPGATLSIIPNGTCDAAGCTATTAGAHTVTASAPVGATTVTGTATLTVTGGTAGTADAVTAVSGDGQSANTGSTFPLPLVVRVQDGAAGPVAGAPVTFTISGGATFAGGALTGTATAGADGTATSPRLVAGTMPGPFTVTATSGSATPAVFTETVTAVTPARADLKTTVTGPAVGAANAVVSVNLTVANLGPAQADRTLAVLSVPSGMVVKDAGGGRVLRGAIVFDLGNLRSGTSQSRIIQLTPVRTRQPVRIVAALATSATPDPVRRNNVAATTIRIR